MAQLALTGLLDRFPSGTTVGAYPQSNWATFQIPPSGAPVGSATTTGSVSAVGAVTLTGLAADTDYFITDSSGTKYVSSSTRQTHAGPIKDPGGADGDMLVRSGGTFAVLAKGGTSQELMVRSDGTVNWVAPFTSHLNAWGADPSGAVDSAAAVQSAITAVENAGGGIVQGSQGTYLFNSTPHFQKNGTSGVVGTRGWVSIAGAGKDVTTFKLGTAARFFDPDPAFNAHDVFARTEFRDATFDDNNSAAGSFHIIYGNRTNANGWTNRINFDSIAFRRLRGVNAAQSASDGGRQWISMSPRHTAANEATQNFVRKIVGEDLDLNGGNSGWNFHGGGITADGSKVNVIVDDISLRYVNWDGGAPFAANGTGGNQIGGLAEVGRVRIYGGLSANSPDVGVEFDQVQDLVMIGHTARDCRQEGYLFRCFRDPTDLGSMRNLAVGCTAETTTNDPSLAGPQTRHYMIGGDTSTAGFTFGALELIGCRSRYTTAMAASDYRGAVLSAWGCRFRRLVARDLTIAMPNLAINQAGSATFSPIDIQPSNSDCEVVLDWPRYRLAGTRAGAGTVTMMYVRLNGAMKATVNGPIVNDLVTGRTFAKDLHHVVRVGDLGSSTIVPMIRGTRVEAYDTTGGGGVNAARVDGITIASTANLTIGAGKQAVAEGCDFSGAPAGNGLDYNIDSTQNGLFIARSLAGTRTSGSSPPTARATITVGGSPFIYHNTDNIAEEVVCSGGTVSLIEWSADNSTFDAVTGATGGVFRVGPHQSVRVTYSVAPTMVKVPSK